MATRDLILKIDEFAFVRLVEAARKAHMTPAEYAWTLMEKGRLGALQPGATEVINLPADMTPVLERLDRLGQLMASLRKDMAPKEPEPGKLRHPTSVEIMFASLLDKIIQLEDKLAGRTPSEGATAEQIRAAPLPNLDLPITTSEIRVVKSLRAAGNSIAEIARELGRTQAQIREAFR